MFPRRWCYSARWVFYFVVFSSPCDLQHWDSGGVASPLWSKWPRTHPDGGCALCTPVSWVLGHRHRAEEVRWGEHPGSRAAGTASTVTHGPRPPVLHASPCLCVSAASAGPCPVGGGREAGPQVHSAASSLVAAAGTAVRCNASQLLPRVPHDAGWGAGSPGGDGAAAPQRPGRRARAQPDSSRVAAAAGAEPRLDAVRRRPSRVPPAPPGPAPRARGSRAETPWA